VARIEETTGLFLYLVRHEETKDTVNRRLSSTRYEELLPKLKMNSFGNGVCLDGTYRIPFSMRLSKKKLYKEPPTLHLKLGTASVKIDYYLEAKLMGIDGIPIASARNPIQFCHNTAIIPELYFRTGASFVNNDDCVLSVSNHDTGTCTLGRLHADNDYKHLVVDFKIDNTECVHDVKSYRIVLVQNLSVCDTFFLESKVAEKVVESNCKAGEKEDLTF